MATKPSTTFEWSTDTNFSSGPDSGTVTKVNPPGHPQGFIPGAGIFATHVNYLFNVIGDWQTNWVALGSSTGAEDAHIVETDSDGETNIARLNVIGHSTTGAAFTADNSNGNFSAVVTQNASLAALRCTQQGSGFVAEFLGLTGSGGGITATAGTGGNGVGGSFTGQGTGNGITCQAGATGGYGADVTGTGSFAGLRATGSGAGAGVIANAGTGSPAVEAHGETSSPVRASLHIGTQGSVPSSTVDGDLRKRGGIASTSRGYLAIADAAGASASGNAVGGAGEQKVWTTEDGIGYQYESDESVSTTTSTTFVTKLGFTLDSPNPLTPEGEYILTWSCEVDAQITLAGLQLIVVQVTVGGTQQARAYQYVHSLGDDWQTLSGIIPVTLGAAPITINLDYRTTNASMTAAIRRARFFIRGCYEF